MVHSDASVSVPTENVDKPAIPRLTKEQAAIVGAFTGYLAGPFSDMHEYIERVMERPVWTHELAEKAFCEQLRNAAKSDFLAMVYEGKPTKVEPGSVGMEAKPE
jgi:hypothetical protein